MPDEDPEPQKVTRISWQPRDHILTGLDYLFGMIIEIPEMYYVIPDQTMAYVYVHPKGLIRVHHDFSHLSKDDIDRVVYYIRRDLSGS